MQKIVLFIVICLLSTAAFSQKRVDLTPKEKEYYNTIKGLCHFLQTNQNALNDRDTIFKKWILFDYVLNDTSLSIKNERVKQMDQLLERFKHFIDSTGINNLDASPIRYYKDYKEIFKPFGEELAEQAPETFAYYNKKNPQKPIGYLLFDRKTGKLVSWVLINQGGYCYFLTFSLL